MESKAELLMKYWGTTDSKEITRQDANFGNIEGKNLPRDLKEWVEMDFPYYAPEDELPAPLPTMAEIEAARFGDTNMTRNKYELQHIFRLSGVYAVKFSLHAVTIQEAENLLFLSKNTKIRVPKVYAAFEHKGADPLGEVGSRICPDRSFLPIYYYLIMEYIPGKPCTERNFNRLSPKTQENIVRKVAKEMRLLRNVPAPAPEYYGRIYHRGWAPAFPNLTRYGPPGYLKGPFDSHEDFINAVYTSSQIMASSQGVPEEDLQYICKLYLHTFRQIMSRAAGKTPVLCHPDFHFDKVIILENPVDKDDPDVAIVSWGMMGWVPEYMATERSFHKTPNLTLRMLYNWEMSKSIVEPHLDVALYFETFCAKTANNEHKHK
ncbi:hypothetical protein K505DRAFT_258930 [Melanomma pulvis-pyrius CBS 109.77]|uniref:Aminoglycoside phosphotransferase domain-containing protein n=1 Tax=Melanomma pulvis-pyrius CBS 109.77 TaxID=1314802 RepID=A0A6A6WRY2_9PLEO|nr:hypothetical protein K505DRAFT_258930 [Melanomma pulvis-pyrius CBS 109.77]